MEVIDNQSLLNLRKLLPIDGVSRIKKLLKDEYSITYIYYVLRGIRRQDAIIAAAIEIVKEEKDKKDSLNNQINELTSE